MSDSTQPVSPVSPVHLYAGGPCCCVPGGARRVRWVDPPGVPGLAGRVGAVHCRAEGETGDRSKRTHPIPAPGSPEAPAGVVIALRCCPVLELEPGR